MANIGVAREMFVITLAPFARVTKQALITPHIKAISTSSIMGTVSEKHVPGTGVPLKSLPLTLAFRRPAS